MTCPFYRKIGEKNSCAQYGEQSESKSGEECQKDFVYCLQGAREQTKDEISGKNLPESISAQRTEAIKGESLDSRKSFF